MKKFLILLTVLLLGITLSCKTIPEKQKITLPPMPEHVDFEPVSSVREMGIVIVQQDAIIKSWEAWGKNVEGIINGDRPDGSN